MNNREVFVIRRKISQSEILADAIDRRLSLEAHRTRVDIEDVDTAFQV